MFKGDSTALDRYLVALFAPYRERNFFGIPNGAITGFQRDVEYSTSGKVKD
jgi:hypothetical protein